MRLVFAGTPEPALPSLRRLIDSPRHEVIAVLTRPDAASGRRGRPSPSPVARLALEHDIPLLRPARPNADEFVAELTELAPECCAVVAYGALLSERLLAVPKHGWVNLHFSLLPAWRGAAPVQAAIAAGDTVTGATTFQIEPSLDSGPVYGVVTETIRPTDTAGDLLERLSISGASPAGDDPGRHRRRVAESGAAAVGRDHGGAEDHRRAGAGALGPARPRRRAAHPGGHPQPRRVDADRRSARQAGTGRRYPPIRRNTLPPGAIRVDRDGVRVGTGSQPVLLGRIQPPGRKPMAAADWARGARLDESVTAQ